MSAAKRKRHSASHPSGPARLISFLRGPGRPIVLIALLVALLAGGWCLVWPKVRGHALRSGEYVIGPQQVEITPPPKWIHSDVRSEVFHNTSLEGSLSILDDDLVERIGNAFSLHPWVARVQRVTKHYPARVKVELLYRRPVCMVRRPADCSRSTPGACCCPAPTSRPMKRPATRDWSASRWFPRGRWARVGAMPGWSAARRLPTCWAGSGSG